MTTMNELIAECTALLQNTGAAGMASSQPCAPMAVVYGGGVAHQYRSFIDDAFREVWRARAAQICQLVLRGTEVNLSEADGTCVPLEEQELYERVTTMYESSSVFLNMKTGIMCFVASSDDYGSPEELQAAWLRADELKKQLQFPHIMCVLILNEGMGKAEFAAKVRAWMKECTLPTLVLSNVLANGSRLGTGRISEAYTLAAAVMIIANTWDRQNQNYFPTLMSMFPGSGSCVLTASYSRIERPDREICETVLFCVLTWISSHMRKGKPISHTDMVARLKLGNFPGNLLDDFFESNVKPLLPDSQILESLPRKKGQNPIANQPFMQFNAETFGTFNGFFELNCSTVATNIDGDVMRHFRAVFRSTLEKLVNTIDAANSLDETNIERILADVTGPEVTEKAGTFSYMTTQAKLQFVDCAKVIIREELLRWYKAANDRLSNLTELVNEFHDVFVAKNDSLERFYSNIANMQLMNDPGDKLLERFSSISSREEMLQALKNCVSEIYRSDTIFSVSLAEEMARRLALAGDQVNVQINQQLVDNLEMYFAPTTAPDFCLRALIMDSIDNNGQSTTLFNYLDKYFHGVMDIDTGNGNRVDLIELYRCNYI